MSKVILFLCQKSNIIRSLSVILIFASISLVTFKGLYIRLQALTTVLKKKKCIIQVEKRQNT